MVALVPHTPQLCSPLQIVFVFVRTHVISIRQSRRQCRRCIRMGLTSGWALYDFDRYVVEYSTQHSSTQTRVFLIASISCCSVAVDWLFTTDLTLFEVCPGTSQVRAAGTSRLGQHYQQCVMNKSIYQFNVGTHAYGSLCDHHTHVFEPYECVRLTAK